MKLTMVIADDEPLSLKSEELLVKREFPDIEICGLAENGIELKEMLEALQPDIAIVDVRMPGLTGLEVIELLRQKNVKTHYIVNTAYSDFEYVKSALNLKTDGYILKPGKRGEMVKVISEAVERVREERARLKKDTEMQAALKLVNPMLGSEILMSIFTARCDEENFQTYLTLNDIRFHQGCIMTYLPSGSSGAFALDHPETILQETLSTICPYIYAVTKSSIVIMIFLPEGENTEALSAWCQDVERLILSKLEEAEENGILHGVGGIYDSFTDMKKSYEESIARIENERTEKNTSEEMNYVACAQKYIRSHFTEDISLDDCALIAGVNAFYLSHIFREQTGQTFVEYLTQVRMQRCKELCQDPMQSIKDIAAQSGYSNISYFYRVFKKATGKTIGEYRKDVCHVEDQ